jgi:hypothetical protein
MAEGASDHADFDVSPCAVRPVLTPISPYQNPPP